jgi:hypothetical protein
MRRALLLATLLVLAGCSAPTAGGPAAPAGPTDAPEPATDAPDTATASPDRTTTAPGDDPTTDRPDDEETDDALVTVEGPDPDANETDLFLRTRALLEADTDPPRVVVTASPDVDFPATRVDRTFRALWIPRLDPDDPRRPATGGFPTASPAFYYPQTHTIYVNPVYVDNAAVNIEEILIEEFAHAVQFRNATFDAYYDPLVDGTRFRANLTTDERLTAIAVREGVGDVFVTARVQSVSLGLAADETIGAVVETRYSRSGVGYRLGFGPYLFGYEYADRRIDRAVETFSVYADPPETGEQVLHDTDEAPTPLTVEVEGDLERLRADTYGELFLRPALTAGLNRSAAERAAEGWGNDRLLNLSYDGPDGRQQGFVWVLDWDSAVEAEEFARLFAEYVVERGRPAADGRYTLEGREWDLRRLDDDTVAVVIGSASFHEAVSVTASGANVTVSG